MVLLVLVLNYVLATPPGAAMSMPIGDDPDAAELPACRSSADADLGLHAGRPDLRLCRLGDDRAPRFGLADNRQLANIESITAVVIGGISLFGGRGSILGMLFGALIVGVFSLGCGCSAPTRSGPIS
jgi:fructose transport system permease protein